MSRVQQLKSLNLSFYKYINDVSPDLNLKFSMLRVDNPLPYISSVLLQAQCYYPWIWEMNSILLSVVTRDGFSTYRGLAKLSRQYLHKRFFFPRIELACFSSNASLLPHNKHNRVWPQVNKTCDVLISFRLQPFKNACFGAARPLP